MPLITRIPETPQLVDRKAARPVSATPWLQAEWAEWLSAAERRNLNRANRERIWRDDCPAVLAKDSSREPLRGRQFDPQQFRPVVEHGSSQIEADGGSTRFQQPLRVEGVERAQAAS